MPNNDRDIAWTPMPLTEALDEALAVSDAMTKLGYLNDHVFFATYNDDYKTGAPPTKIDIVLRAGGREFVYRLAMVAAPRAEVLAAWTTAVRRWNELPQHDRETLWQASHIRRDLIGLIAALAARGFDTSPQYNRARYSAPVN